MAKKKTQQNKLYGDAQYVRDLTGCGLTNARELIQKINKEIDESKGYVPCNYRAPKALILEKLRLSGEQQSDDTIQTKQEIIELKS